MKKIDITLRILAVFLLGSISLPVFAQGSTGATGSSTNRSQQIEARATQRQENRETIQTQTIERLKTKARKEIERRIASLNKLMEKINAVKRLTDAQKTTMVGQVQAEITSLTTLRSQIEGDTVMETLRAHVQSIVQSYRIYVLYIPKMTIIANGDKILNLLSGDVATLTAKLQTRINELNSKGVDTSSMASLMASRAAKLVDAASKAQTAIDMVIGLTPDGWPDNKAELQNARELLSSSRKDIAEAQKIAGQIRAKFGELNPTGTPKLTNTPRPTE